MHWPVHQLNWWLFPCRSRSGGGGFDESFPTCALFLVMTLSSCAKVMGEGPMNHSPPVLFFWWWLLALVQRLGGRAQWIIPHQHFFFFLCVETSSHASVPLFQANDQSTMAHQADLMTWRHPTQTVGSREYVLNCDLPLGNRSRMTGVFYLLLQYLGSMAEWFGSFTCYCSNWIVWQDDWGLLLATAVTG